MPFLGENGLTKDKHQLLGEILEEGAYADKSAFEKTKIILSNASHMWEDVGHAIVGHSTEDQDFMRNMAKKGSLDLAKENGIQFHNVPKLRESVSQLEFEDTLKDIRRQEQEEREANLVSKSGTGWEVMSMGASILGDPLLLPMMAMPEMIPARMGRASRAASGAVLDGAISYGYQKTMDAITGQKTDIGNLVGNMMVDGFIGGSIISGIDAYQARKLKDSVIDEVTNKALTVQEGAVRGMLDNKDIKLSDSLVSRRNEIIKQVSPMVNDLEGMRVQVRESLKHTPYAHLEDELIEIWKREQVESVINNPEHPLMKDLHEKMGVRKGEEPKDIKQLDTDLNAEIVDSERPKELKQIDVRTEEIKPKLSGANKGLLTIGALSFMATGEIKADSGEDSYSPLDLVLLAGMGALAIKHRKGITAITGRINSRLIAQKRLKNILKFDSLSAEGFGLIGGTKFFHEGLKKLDGSSPVSSKLGSVMLDNLKSIMENSEGVIEQVSALKSELRDDVLNKLFADVAGHYEDFKKEIKFKSLNPIKHVRLRERFYEEIGKAYTLGKFDDLSDAQKKAVDGFRRGFDTVYKRMKEANVKGMDSFKQDKNYFPRFHNPSAYDYVAGLTMTNRDKIRVWYGNAIKRGFIKKYGKNITNEQADKLAKQLLVSGQSNNFLDVLKNDSLFDELDLENIDKQFGRTMSRIPIDFSVKGLDIDGKTLEMTDFVDTNAYSVMNRYLNQSAGHYAFGMHGIPSVDEAIKAVEKEFENNGGSTKLRDSITDYANSIIGRPIIDSFNRGIVDMAGLLSKATSTQFLHMSGITTMSEVIPAIASSLLNSNFGDSWKAFIKTSRTALEDIKIDSITDELAQFGGYGQKRVNSRESLSNPRVYTGEDFGMNSEAFKSLDRGLTAMQKVTFFMNQLPMFEDFANLMNVKKSHDTIMSHLRGEKLFNERRKEGLGLNAEREKVLQGIKDKVTDNSLNMDKWTDDEVGAYKTVLTQLQRAKVGEMVLGDIPRGIMKNPIAKMLMTLLSFPIQSFDNLLLRDMYARDGESIFRFKMMMAGTAMSILMKDAVGGSSKRRKRDDEDLHFIERVISGLPHVGIMSIASQLFNDRKVTLGTLFPTISVLENALNAPKSTANIMLGRANTTDRKVMLQLLSVPFAMQKVLSGEPQKSKTALGGLEGLGATVGGLR